MIPTFEEILRTSPVSGPVLLSMVFRIMPFVDQPLLHMENLAPECVFCSTRRHPPCRVSRQLQQAIASTQVLKASRGDTGCYFFGTDSGGNPRASKKEAARLRRRTCHAVPAREAQAVLNRYQPAEVGKEERDRAPGSISPATRASIIGSGD